MWPRETDPHLFVCEINVIGKQCELLLANYFDNLNWTRVFLPLLKIVNSALLRGVYQWKLTLHRLSCLHVDSLPYGQAFFSFHFFLRSFVSVIIKSVSASAAAAKSLNVLTEQNDTILKRAKNYAKLLSCVSALSITLSDVVKEGFGGLLMVGRRRCKADIMWGNKSNKTVRWNCGNKENGLITFNMKCATGSRKCC